MKKLIVRLVAFLLIVGGLTASFLIIKPKEELKADTPSLYYFDLDTSHENYMSIILYVLDVANLQDDTCYFVIVGAYYSPPYEAISSSYQAQFLRYSQFDHDDYIAYVYNFQYPVITSWRVYMCQLLSANVLSLDNNTYISSNIFLPYYPTFQSFYEEGEDAGYIDGTNDRNAYWEDYIQDTYLSTTGSGYQLIYSEGRAAGYTEGQDSLDTMGWFGTITEGASDIMALKLLPSITIGALIFIPLMFMILKGVLYIWRRN